MATRITLAEAERRLCAAGYRTEREFAGKITFFLAARLPPSTMPTKLECFKELVSEQTVRKLENKAARKT